MRDDITAYADRPNGEQSFIPDLIGNCSMSEDDIRSDVSIVQNIKAPKVPSFPGMTIPPKLQKN